MRHIVSLMALFSGVASASAQPYLLHEKNLSGDRYRIAISLAINGKLKTGGPDGKIEELALQATASHRYIEWVEQADNAGVIGKAIRGYNACESTAALPGTTTKRSLDKERRVVVVQKEPTGPILYSTAGPLTRDELDVAAGQFDTMALPGLLPGKAVNVNDTWPIAPPIVQSICLFDGLTKHSLVGKLTHVKNHIATFTVTGDAEGVEVGAVVKLKITLTGEFDLTTNRITKVTAEEIDNREQGPVAPACAVTAKLELTRERVTEPTLELNDGHRATVPPGNTAPANLIALRYDDPAGKYTLLHNRDWHVVAATKEQVVMRLVDRGEFVAQATILAWSKAEAGKHSTPNEIKDAIARQPGWQAEKVLEDGEIASDRGRWIYRLVATGKQDESEVNQAFHLLAGPNGDQVVMTVIVRKEKADRIAGRDVELLSAVEFPKK